MSEYLETYFDPDFGTIAVVRDGKDGPIVASAADNGHGLIIDEIQIFEHGFLIHWEISLPDAGIGAHHE